MDGSRRSFLKARTPATQVEQAPVAVSGACLARHGVECRLCADVCDTRALRFFPAPGGIAQLRLEPQHCTQCGDCVAPCPVGAITVAPREN